MIGYTPELVSVDVAGHGVLRLRFSDGVSGEVEVLSRLVGPVFAGARSPDGFAQARFDPESRTVAWPGGADLAPDTLYLRVSTGVWPHAASPA